MEKLKSKLNKSLFLFSLILKKSSFKCFKQNDKLQNEIDIIIQGKHDNLSTDIYNLLF
jgi:hypothetical protein